MRVASDTGPIIHLARIGGLELIKELFGEISITPEVKAEALDEGEERCPDVILIENAIGEGWIKVVKSDKGDRELTRFGLHNAEAGLIQHALSEKIELVLLDDDAAREVARTLGLKVKGSLGIVIEAFRKGRIPKKRALAMLDELMRVMHLSASVYKTAKDAIEGI
ncbi:MAG: hypothetical protein V3R86_01000 [Candidatus Hydrothermarchaeaceae archaeon]